MAANRCDKLSNLCKEAFSAACRAALPSKCVQKSLNRQGNRLLYNGKSYDLRNNVYLVAFGKAAASMVEGAEKVLGEDLVEGIASVPIGTKASGSLKSRFYEGARNNLPDEAAEANSKRIVEFLEKARKDERNIVMVLVSGGGSALLPLPVDGITLEEKLETIKVLASRGYDIKQLNLVRQRLSKLKGGKLAELTAPCKVLGVIMSDIVGDPISLIASGPTVPQEASKLPEIDFSILPRSVSRILQASSPSPTSQSSNANNSIVCNNKIALDAASEFFASHGYTVEIATSTLEGDASDRANVMRDIVSGLLGKKKHVVLFGGETTVRFPAHGKTGKGGRNQEMALAALKNLSESQDTLPESFAFMSAGTDGQDGPTDAAGAVFTSQDLLPAKENLQKIIEQLKAKDSYNFWTQFEEGRCHFKPSQTGTNVMDIQMIVVE
ncbi:hypothetical protein L596_018145 [Steinernema carpocapsae]|uniref:Glycerate kinase n=1 Tax=Steinernema carpocapsae TaxID=34508 RepID=A0A4U5N3S8_STECR|nr:hypothetical protein L596_018145 [Steinernema carpocapsae]